MKYQNENSPVISLKKTIKFEDDSSIFFSKCILIYTKRVIVGIISSLPFISFCFLYLRFSKYTYFIVLTDAQNQVDQMYHKLTDSLFYFFFVIQVLTDINNGTVNIFYLHLCIDTRFFFEVFQSFFFFFWLVFCRYSSSVQDHKEVKNLLSLLIL